MTDDWKGEHLIRRRPTKAERRRADCSALSSTIAEINRRKGIKPPSHKQHGQFVTRVFAQMHMIAKMEAEAK